MVLNTVSINLICILVAKKVIAFFKVIAERQGIKLAEEVRRCAFDNDDEEDDDNNDEDDDGVDGIASKNHLRQPTHPGGHELSSFP